MTNATLEKLIWALIYGGLLAAVLGLFVALQNGMAGWYTGEVLAVGGIAAVFVGAVLIWVRSRRGP